MVNGVHDLTPRHPGLDESQPIQDTMDCLWRIFNEDTHDEDVAFRYTEDIDFAKLKEHVAEAYAEKKRETAEVSEGRRLFRHLLQKLTTYLV